MNKIKIIITLCLLSSLIACKEEIDNRENRDALQAGVVPKSYIAYYHFGPDTIYQAEREIDFTGDSIPDLRFVSGEGDIDGTGRPGYICTARIDLIDSSFSIAAFKLWSTRLIHQGDAIDSTLSWRSYQFYGAVVTLNQIISTRGYFDKFYMDSTGYIGLKHEVNLGWLKIKVEGCSKIILYEYLMK